MDFSAVEQYTKFSYEKKLKIISDFLGDNISLFECYEHDSQVVLQHRKSLLEFVYIPEGYYKMGFTFENQKNAELINNPVNADYDEMRPVTIQHVAPFLVTRTPVLEKNILKNNSNKIMFVRYEQALQYAQKNNMRIPTEIEWEYMASAGEKNLFPFGDKLLPENELEKWMSFEYNNLNQCYANKLGIYGLFTGEWTSSDYKKNYKIETAIENHKVIRGGAAVFWPWQDQEWVWCITAMRMPSSELLDGTCGFRLIYIPADKLSR